MSELLNAYQNASKEEQMMFAAAISAQHGANSEIYAALKRIETEKETKFAKQLELERGEKLRRESMEKFNKLWEGKL